MATIINNSGVEQNSKGFHTYYIKIEKDGATYYKLGYATGTIKKRYGKEPPEVRITILKLWVHTTENKMWAHEAKLFKQYKGDRPFIGRCSPLLFAKGSTEVYSHDVMGGEPPPHSFVVRIYSLSDICLHTVGYSGFNPRSQFSHLCGQVPYMNYLWGPVDIGEGDYYQIPQLSAKERVVIATESFLTNRVDECTPSERWFPKKWAVEALSQPIIVRSWSDHVLMNFEGTPFKVDRWTEWV